MTLLVRNEDDIIAANIDYHLAQGVDHVIVTDHGSTDETLSLLHEYERAGVATVLEDDGEGHHQSRRVTRMAQLAVTEHAADWLIHNDADEFWWPLVGSLRDVFETMPPAIGQIVVPRRNFRPRPPEDQPFHARLVYREPLSFNRFGDPLESKVAHRGHPDVVLAPGNHWIGGVSLRPLPPSELLEIFHFPMRSYSQFERKVIQTGIGYEQLDARSEGVGRDQLALLEIYRDNELRSHYDGLALHDDELERELETGTVVRDRRLSNFMQKLSVADGSHVHPADGATARAIIARIVEQVLGAEEASAALHVAMEDRAAAWARHAAATDELDAMTRELDTMTRERDSMSDELAVARHEIAALHELLTMTRAQLATAGTRLGSLSTLVGGLGARRLLRRFPRAQARWHGYKMSRR